MRLMQFHSLSRIITPDDNLYWETLADIPNWWNQIQKDKCEPIHLIQEESGLLRAASSSELLDFVLGGELDELEELDEDGVIEETFFL